MQFGATSISATSNSTMQSTSLFSTKPRNAAGFSGFKFSTKPSSFWHKEKCQQKPTGTVERYLGLTKGIFNGSCVLTPIQHEFHCLILNTGRSSFIRGEHIYIVILLYLSWTVHRSGWSWKTFWNIFMVSFLYHKYLDTSASFYSAFFFFYPASYREDSENTPCKFTILS